MGGSAGQDLLRGDGGGKVICGGISGDATEQRMVARQFFSGFMEAATSSMVDRWCSSNVGGAVGAGGWNSSGDVVRLPAEVLPLLLLMTMALPRAADVDEMVLACGSTGARVEVLQLSVVS